MNLYSVVSEDVKLSPKNEKERLKSYFAWQRDSLGMFRVNARPDVLQPDKTNHGRELLLF